MKTYKDFIFEANKVEKHLGMGSNTPENELSRMKRRAYASGIGSRGPEGKPRQILKPGTIRMNRGVAGMVHKRNRGKSPSDPTYTKRSGIDPHADMKSYRDSPLGLPKGYKDPLNSKTVATHNKVNSKVKIKERKPRQGSNNIVKFRKEDYDKIIEAYKDLTPEKEERVKKRVGELARNVQLKAARVKELRKKPLAKFRPGVQSEIQANIKSAKKDAKLVGNASDALIRTSTGRSAKMQKQIEDLKSRENS